MQDFEKKPKATKNVSVKKTNLKKSVKAECDCKKREEPKPLPQPKKKTLKKKPNEVEKGWSISSLFK